MCETDLDGQKRVWDGDGDAPAIVDMGIDEFGSFVYGDVNCDGAVNAFDIEPFLIALFQPDDDPISYPECDIALADLNCEQAVNAFDIEPFLEVLFGPPSG